MTKEEIRASAQKYATRSDGKINLLERNAFIAGANFVSGLIIEKHDCHGKGHECKGDGGPGTIICCRECGRELFEIIGFKNLKQL